MSAALKRAAERLLDEAIESTTDFDQVPTWILGQNEPRNVREYALELAYMTADEEP